MLKTLKFDIFMRSFNLKHVIKLNQLISITNKLSNQAYKLQIILFSKLTYFAKYSLIKIFDSFASFAIFMNLFLLIKLHKLNICKKAFCEFYRISFKNLPSENDFSIFCQFNSKNVAKLIKIYKLKKCLRLEFTHYISTLISRWHFAFIISNITIEFSILFSHQLLIYLHEKHRIKTVRKFFHSNKWWWVVDFYFENRFMYFSFWFKHLLIIDRQFTWIMLIQNFSSNRIF